MALVEYTLVPTKKKVSVATHNACAFDIFSFSLKFKLIHNVRTVVNRRSICFIAEQSS